MAITSAQIRGLVLDVPSDFDFTQVLGIASSMRTEVLEPEDLSDELLDAIELLLAAHFTILVVEKGGLVRDVVGDAAQTYREIHGRQVGLYSTRFGVQAISLDVTGTLSDLSSPNPKAELQVY